MLAAYKKCPDELSRQGIIKNQLLSLVSPAAQTCIRQEGR